MLLGTFSCQFKVTQVRDISFLPLDTVISHRYPELWLPSGDHKEHLPEKTNPHWGWQVERWQEAAFHTFIGCPPSRLALIWENKFLYQVSHFDFIFKILFICLFICLAWHLHNDLIYPKIPFLLGKLFIHQDSLHLTSISTSYISLLQDASHFACSGPILVLVDENRKISDQVDLCSLLCVLVELNDFIWQILLGKISPDQIFSISKRFSALLPQLPSVVTWWLVKETPWSQSEWAQILTCQLQAMWPQKIIQLFYHPHPDPFPHLLITASLLSQCHERNEEVV